MIGVPASFELDTAALRSAWLARSAQLHPDRATSDADASDQQAALARVNHAMRTLGDPLQRAEALLARLGGAGKENDKSLPDGFLAQMLEVREEVEEAAGDAAATAKWETWAQAERNEHEARVAALFRRALASAPADTEALRQIRTQLNAWRYIDRMIEQLGEA